MVVSIWALFLHKASYFSDHLGANRASEERRGILLYRDGLTTFSGSSRWSLQLSESPQDGADLDREREGRVDAVAAVSSDLTLLPFEQPFVSPVRRRPPAVGVTDATIDVSASYFQSALPLSASTAVMWPNC